MRARVHRPVRHCYLARLCALALLTLTTGCAARAGTDGGPPDAEAEARVVAANAPAHRLEVLFDWSMRDRDARFSGRGLLRLDGARRARVDLFGPRGETLAAAIVDAEGLRVVPETAEALLPPAALLWSALGVFHPPADAELTGSAGTDGELVLDYRRDAARWRFRFVDGELRHTEWTAGSGRRTVELTGSAAFGLPASALYRDWTEFRELNLSLTAVDERSAFDADTWILPGER